MNGPLKFLTACKILPLLDLLAKFKRVLACLLVLPNFCIARELTKQIFYFCSCLQKNCSARHARECLQRPFVTPTRQGSFLIKIFWRRLLEYGGVGGGSSTQKVQGSKGSWGMLWKETVEI